MESQVLLFRLVLFSVLAIAHGYLFLRLRHAIRTVRAPAWVRLTAVGGLGAAFAVCYLLYLVIVVRRLPWVDPPFAAQVGLLYPVAIWNVGAGFSALVLAVLRSAGRLRRTARRVWADFRGAEAPVDLRRRAVLRAGVGGLASTPLVFAAYGAAAASMSPEVEEIRLPLGRPLRLVQLSDIHAGLYMTRDDIHRYAELVKRLRPDLLALTGDYISTSMSFLPCFEALAAIRPPHGTFVVMGNHEHWNGDPRATESYFQERGAIVLNNRHVVLDTPAGPIAVAGIDDLKAGHPDLEAALAGVDPALPTILLSHRPEIFPRAAARHVDLTLSGHWHGGQIKLPVLGLNLSLAHLASRYPEGLYRIAASHLYVSRGLGTTGPPIRLNAPPEVTLFHLA